MTTLPLRTLQTGSEDPPPEIRDLDAGPLSLRYEDGALRNLRFGTRECVRRVGPVLRDRSWNAVPFRISALRVAGNAHGFDVDFFAESLRDDLPLRWRAEIRADARSGLRFALDAEVKKPLLCTRIGFGIRLPIKELAGRPCVVERANGAVVKGLFPRYVQPTPFFQDVRALSFEAAPGARARIAVGEPAYEIEDLRNWTDAAYELYWPPATGPLPMEIPAGTKLQARFDLTISGPSNVSRIDPAATSVSVGANPVHPLPRIGLGAASHGRALGPRALGTLKVLRPAHLRLDLRPGDPQATVALRRATAEAKALGAQLEVGLTLSAKGAEELKGFMPALAAANPPVAAWIVQHDTEPVPAERWVQAARELLVPFRPEARVAAGTAAHFSDLNRGRAPKSAELLAFTASPQVHEHDAATLMENLEGLAAAVESARLLPGDRPLIVGAVTLRPRFNPNAAPGAEEPAFRGDPRQRALIGAAWTAAALRAIGQPGVFSATFYETTGPLGVMEREPETGAVPLFHVLADVGEFAGAGMLPWTAGRDLVVDGVALALGGRTRILLANLTPKSQKVRLACPRLAAGATLKRLDESTAPEAMANPLAWRALPSEPLPAVSPLELDLLPYAVLRIDGV
jgi:hypothetical protein